MLGLFRKKDPIDALSKEYEKLLAKAHKVSHSNRAESDRLMAEADKVAQQIEDLRTKSTP